MPAQPFTAPGRNRLRYYTITESAEVLNVSTKTIQRWIADGTLAASRIGRKVVRISESDLDAALKPIPSAVAR